MNERKSVGREINALSHMIRRQIDLSETHKVVENMTGTHGWLMAYLFNHCDRDIFQKDIEGEFHIRRSTVSSVLQLMEKNGMISRVSVERDARLKKIVLTQKAYDVKKQIEADGERLEKLLTNGLTREEIEQFFAVAEKIKCNLIGSDT